MLASKLDQKLTRTHLVTDKAFELPHRPCHQRQIDVTQQWVQRRRSASPVVFDPPPKERIEQLGDVVQRSLRLPTDVQLPNRRSHGFECGDTDRRREAAEQSVIPDTLHQTGPKTVPNEVKFDIRIGTFSLPVFAINDLRFRRMQFQVAFCQSNLKRGYKSRGLGLPTSSEW